MFLGCRIVPRIYQRGRRVEKGNRVMSFFRRLEPFYYHYYYYYYYYYQILRSFERAGEEFGFGRFYWNVRPLMLFFFLSFFLPFFHNLCVRIEERVERTGSMIAIIKKKYKKYYNCKKKNIKNAGYP